MTQGSRWLQIRDAALRVTLVLVSTIAVAAMSEMVVRVVAPVHLGIWTDREMWAHDEILGWRMRPSIEVQQIFGRGRKVPVRLNSQGSREPEEQPVPEPWSVRIMVLGDSFAFGFGVRVEDRLTEVMERRNDAVNCVNFGVSGYSTDQELLLFRRFGRSAAADIVVLLYVANDQPANVSRLGHGYPKPVFVLEDDQLILSNVPVPHAKIRLRLKWELMRRSALFNLIRERTEVVQGWFAPQPPPAVRRPVAKPEIAELDAESFSREMTRRLLLELENESTRVATNSPPSASCRPLKRPSWSPQRTTENRRKGFRDPFLST